MKREYGGGGAVGEGVKLDKTEWQLCPPGQVACHPQGIPCMDSAAKTIGLQGEPMLSQSNWGMEST